MKLAVQAQKLAFAKYCSMLRSPESVLGVWVGFAVGELVRVVGVGVDVGYDVICGVADEAGEGVGEGTGIGVGVGSGEV